MNVFAPAKINLMLHVTGRRADGYHFLQSVMAFTDLGDTLELVPAPAYTLTIDGPFAAHAPDDGRNLVTRAVRLMEAEAGRDAPWAVRLTKNVPAGAGLGGGSADAAAVMHAINRAWGDMFSLQKLQETGVHIGAEIPVCLAAQSCWVTGIGDTVEPLGVGRLHGVVIWPGQMLATADVFRAFAASGHTYSGICDAPDHVGHDWLAQAGNDLEETACTLLSDIRVALDAMAAQADCRLARMTGSGSSVFGLFDDAATAVRAAQKLSAAHPQWWVRDFSVG